MKNRILNMHKVEMLSLGFTDEEDQLKVYVEAEPVVETGKAEIIPKVDEERYDQLKQIIKDGRDTFIAVGLALREIKDRKWYLKEYQSFEDFCAHELGATAIHVNRTINASQLFLKLKDQPIGCFKPINESQARVILELDEEDQIPFAKFIHQQCKHRMKRTTANDIRDLKSKFKGEGEEISTESQVDEEERLNNPAEPKYIDVEAVTTNADGRVESEAEHLPKKTDVYDQLAKTLKHCQGLVEERAPLGELIVLIKQLFALAKGNSTESEKAA